MCFNCLITNRVDVVCFGFYSVENRNQRSQTAQIAEKGLWVDKYKPRTLTELAANKKKVQDFKASSYVQGFHLIMSIVMITVVSYYGDHCWIVSS